MELIGPYLAACALLLVAGAAKAHRPDDTGRAVAQVLGGSSSRMSWVVRIGAAGEIALGAASLVYVGPALAGAVAVSYVGFAGFVVLARRRGGPLASCGCLGTPDTAPTGLHVVVDLGLAASAAWVAAGGSSSWTVSLLARQPWHGVPLVLVSSVCAGLAALALSSSGRLTGARQVLANPVNR